VWPIAIVCLLLTACAQGTHVTAMPSVARTGAGTILSMRMVSGYSTQEPQLTAFRVSSGATGVANATSRVEFIVRADDGTTLSIVQPNDRGFRAGDRVVILHENETRLAPPS
jgi:hypothetical protein